MSIRVAEIQTENFMLNLRHARGAEYPCIVCGKPVKNPKHSIRLHGGGSLIVTRAEAEALNAKGEDGGDMYYYPVGPDCARKCAALAPYIADAAEGES